MKTFSNLRVLFSVPKMNMFSLKDQNCASKSRQKLLKLLNLTIF